MTLKAKVRELTRSERDSLSLAAIRTKSDRIQEKFITLKEFEQCKVLASYYPFGSEVRTFRITEKAFENNKVISLPKISRRFMDFYRITPSTNFYTNKFGIKEPIAHLAQRVSQELDLVVVPGLAFDTSGYRIGYGYGYYDRFLADKRNSIICVGLAYDSQVVQQVPHLNHDTKLDILLTEKRIFYF
jgi:5-formyltetrahydrofolate cyclo-ligase